MADRRCTVVLFVFLLCTLAAKVAGEQSPSIRDSQETLGYAQEAYDHGRPDKAIAALTNYLSAHPADFDANELMGLSLVAGQRFGDAKIFLQAAVKVNPNSALARANLATDLAELNETDAAEIQFKEALALNPRSAELNHNFGEFYAARGRLKEAIPRLRSAQQLHPTYNNGYDLAVIEMENGALDAAENDARTLLRQQKTAELHSLLGTILEKKRNYLAAAGEMQQAALMDPSEDNLFAWGTELARHQTLPPAAEVFERGVKQFPNSSKLLTGLGVTEYLMGHNTAAIEAFCAAIDLNPKDAELYFFLSRVHGVPEAQRAAVSQRFEQFVRESPNDAKARYYYAMNLWDSSNEGADGTDAQKAKSLLQESITLDPKFADAHLQLGILYSQDGNDDAAIKEFEQCITLEPSLNVAHYRLGQALIRKGEMERGRKELDQWKVLKGQEQADTANRQKEILQFLYSPAKP
jgi:tetratricopeptide (TPR) repeat protein